MSLTVTQSNGGNFKPHPEGIHPAICVDVVDLGMQEQTFQGQTKIVQKCKIIFETEQETDEGVKMTISKNFTLSLHPKASLNKFLSKWRGKDIGEGENIDLEKLIGVCATLVIAENQNPATGKRYTSIDAISKPTKKIVASGNYNAAETRKRLAEWAAKNGKTIVETKPQPSDNDGGNVDDVGF